MTKEINLMPFCSRDDLRPALHKPSSRGEFTYATNGHILIRVPRRDDVEDNPDFPNAEKVIAVTEGRHLFVLPVMNLPPAADEITCLDCDATGMAHQCPDCTCECMTCRGSGKVAADAEDCVAFDGVPFAIGYVRMIAALPGVRVAVGKEAHEPLRFEFDGGIGALMPIMRKTGNCTEVILRDIFA